MKKPSAWIFIGMVALLAVFAYTTLPHYGQGSGPRYQASLPMTFDHQSHGQQQCIDCHHNFIDDTGQGLCIQCHIGDPALNRQFEDQFHTLCRGCHEEKQALGEEHGPIRQCRDCHEEDQLP